MLLKCVLIKFKDNTSWYNKFWQFVVLFKDRSIFSIWRDGHVQIGKWNFKFNWIEFGG